MFEKKIESERTRWTDRERGKERGVDGGASELQIEQDRDRDERAQETERAERESKRKRSPNRKMCPKRDS